MASLCPQCGNSIEQDFGVATCSRCQAVLFIDMDGNISASAESQAENSLSVQQDFNADNGLSFDAAENSLQEIHQPESDFQNNENSWMSSESHSVAAGSEVQETEQSFEQPPLQEPEPSPEYMSSEIQSSHNGFEAPALEDPPSNDFNDVSDYANSDQTLGSLVYAVLIENIDTKETRELLLEALTDSKFQWDAKELLKQVKMGKFKLEDLNPVKASVLVFRLQDLPVKVSWIQNAYS